MSGISAGIGLISGIDTASLIEQLIAIESRPVQRLRLRSQEIDVQRAALLELSAQILSAQNSSLRFGRSSFFNAFAATSSNENILTATADESAAAGSHTFRVRSLVTSHSLISRGFRDRDRSPVGSGSISIEVGGGRVNPATRLDRLNGGAGVRRGVITITDRSGASAEVDLTIAMTVEDVLAAINSAPGINVRARVTSLDQNGARGDRIVIEDMNSPRADGTFTTTLQVTDKAGGQTAADLGIATTAAASVTDGRIDGRDLIFLNDSTPLSLLNDGNGVGRIGQFIPTGDLRFEFNPGDESEVLFKVSLSDVLTTGAPLEILNEGNGVRSGTIRITSRSGQSGEVDLSQAVTVGDVLIAINAANLGVTASFVNSRLQIIDESGASDDEAVDLVVEDVVGFAAADLGIAGSEEGNSIRGDDIYRVATVGDVIRAINHAPGNDAVVASISADGGGITLEIADDFIVPGPIFVSSVGASTVAEDLGIAGAVVDNFVDGAFHGRRIIAGLNTVLLDSLNGGQGVTAGEVSFTDRAGATTVIDFSPAQSLQDVVDLINADSGSFTASVGSTGNSIELTDESGGSGSITISDVSGNLAVDLNIALDPQSGGDPDTSSVSSGNLQLQYISRQTLLGELRSGRGVALGRFRITAADGNVADVNLPANIETVGELLDSINSAGSAAGIEARINDTGDGIAIVDNSGGAGSLTIEDVQGGRSAADLRIAGTAEEGETVIDGSYEFRVEVGGADTLEDLARKINESGGDFRASILSNPSGLNPFSLSITSGVTGTSGELVIDTAGLDLGLSTLSRAQDAVVSVGGSGTSNPLLISSPTNTLENIIPGVTLDLLGAGDEDVTISVTQDIDSMVEGMGDFVDRFNGILATIDDLTRFNPDTQERGLLLGDSTVNLIRSRLQRLPLRSFAAGAGSFSRLSAVGIRVADSQGGAQARFRIGFDEERFRTAFAESPELVEQFFTDEEGGVGVVIRETLEEMTRSFDGVISRRDDLLQDRQELLNDRIAAGEQLLEGKRARLEVQFIGLERSLALLQGQQSALNSLSGALALR